MVSTCSVLSCASPRGKDIMYHAFPNNPSMVPIWIKACCGGQDLPMEPGRSPRVCSRHFAPDAFQRDLRNELLGLAPRRRLKPDAVPTLFLTFEDSGEKAPRKKRKPYQRNSNQKKSQSASKSTLDYTIWVKEKVLPDVKEENEVVDGKLQEPETTIPIIKRDPLSLEPSDEEDLLMESNFEDHPCDFIKEEI